MDAVERATYALKLQTIMRKAFGGLDHRQIDFDSLPEAPRQWLVENLVIKEIFEVKKK